MINILRNQKRGLNRFSKLPDDGDTWAPNNLLKPGAKEKHQLDPGAKHQLDHLRAIKEGSIVINHDWVKNKHTDCRMIFKL